MFEEKKGGRCCSVGGQGGVRDKMLGFYSAINGKGFEQRNDTSLPFKRWLAACGALFGEEQEGRARTPVRKPVCHLDHR